MIFLNRTTYFRFFIASNLWYCNFLKFLMVTEEWNPAVKARSWIQLLWPKEPKLSNIKWLSLTHYKLNPLRPPSFFFEFKYALYCLQWEIDDFLFFEFLSLFYIFLLIHCYFVCDDSSSESVFSKQFKSPSFTLKCFVLYGFQKFQSYFSN